MQKINLKTNKNNSLDGVFLIKPAIFSDNRGYFYESWNDDKFNEMVYDYRGNHIKSLLNGYYNPGLGQVKWNSRNDSGEKVAAGIYFYKIETNNYVKSKKMILLK